MRLAWLGLSLSLVFLGRCGGGQSDSAHRARDVVQGENTAPVVTIGTPTEGKVVNAGSTVVLSGRAEDDWDGPGKLVFRWTSNLHGQFAPEATSASDWSTVEATLIEAGLHTITLYATDSQGAVGEASVHVTVNGAPGAPQVTIAPAVPTTDDALVATVASAAIDPNGDGVTYAYLWFKDGVDTGFAVPRVEPAETTRGEHWRVRVTAFDGTLFGEPATADITIADSTPSCDAAVLLPSEGDTTSTFTCRCQGRHDVDSADTAHDTCIFYDGERVIATIDASDGICTLTPDHTTRGDELHCDYRASDGDQTADAKTSATITVANAAPPAVEVTLGPPTATVETELTCHVVAPVVDVDGDPVSYISTWVVNGHASAESTTMTVVAGALLRNEAGDHSRRGDEIWCRVSAYDGIAESRPSDSNHVTLGNEPPSGGTVLVQIPAGEDAATEGDTLTCAASGATDPDDDSVQWTYTWTVNDILVDGATDRTLTSDHFDKGDRVACAATPTDGTNPGATVPSNTVATIGNSLPSLVRATLSPTETNHPGTFTCAFEGWADADLSDATPTVAYAWFIGTRGAGIVIAGKTDPTLPAAGLALGATVYCRVTPFNGPALGTPVESGIGTVINHKPIITQAKLSPTAAFADSTLTCEAVGASDEDGDPVTVRYAWQKGGQPIDGAHDATLVTGFAKGDQIRCTATPNDSWTDGVTELSEPVAIGNRLPRITGVTLAPSYGTPCDTYTCSADSVIDPDPGDTILTSYRWVLNGNPLPDATSTLAGQGRLAPDDIVQCFVKATDGSHDANLNPVSGPEEASNEADLYNSPPTVGTVILQPSAPLVGATLTCTPSGFADSECNPSPAYAYRWYRGAEEIAGAAAKTLATTGMADGTSIACQAIPFDGWDYGTPKLSAPVTVRIDVDGCAASPCFAGVPCTDVPAPGTGYTCGPCPPGTTGDGATCLDIDGCTGSPCFTGATCNDVPAPGAGHTCGACPPGYSGDGTTCADTDGCAGGPCFAGVSCTDVAAPSTGHTCGACPPGTTGNGTLCADIDGCAGSPCFGGVICTDVSAPGAGHTCGACTPGTTGNGTTCTDIDGCAGSPCFAGVSCTDVLAPGTGHACGPCPPGYTGDGTTCTDIDGCAGAQCFAGVGCADVLAPGTGHTCGACPAGYTGNGTTCADIDACFNAPCISGASCTDLPAPAPGDALGRTCACAAGYHYDETQGCIDVNECDDGADLCGTQSTCDNFGGGYQCICDEGTIDLHGDGSECSTAVQAAAGAFHSCAIVSTGALYCWGSNEHGQLGDGTTADRSSPVQVGSATNWTSISAGQSHTCGTRDGVLFCWGVNNSGQLGDGTNTGRKSPVQVGSASDWSRVSAGQAHTCGLRTGLLFCWGSNATGQLGDSTLTLRPAPVQIGSATNWGSVSAGGRHTCGLRAGTLYCWGSNQFGQLGDSTTTDRTEPVQIGSSADWANLVAGSVHSCAVRSGALFCWGWNYYGQLGDGTNADRSLPVQVGSATDWSIVAAGSSGSEHTCGLRAGALYCWGWNDYGQLGDGTITDRPAPVRVGFATDWSSLAVGQRHTCGLRAGAIYCWGRNQLGQLGDGNTTIRPSPVQVGAATNWSSLAADNQYTCGLRGGALYCWGDNATGQLGDGTTMDRSSPIQIGSVTNWSGVAAGQHHTCGLRAGALYCWGYNRYGQLGDGTTTDRSSPVQVGSATNWSNVAAGQLCTCAVSNGTLYCWGYNYYGQLGDGTSTDRSSPVQIGSATDWSGISAGQHHTCGLRAGALYCWGSNSYGELGDGTTTTQTSPVQVGSAIDWSAVTVGVPHTCGLRGGALYCWGSNSYGQLGDSIGAGLSSARSSPVQVGTATNWSGITAGELHTCGLRGGALYCWGSNSYGQLGDSTITQRTAPVQVGSTTTWSSITAGNNHACGIRDGALSCWGNNDNYQLGIGDTWSPQPVLFSP